MGFGQGKISVKGVIADAESGQAIEFATISVFDEAGQLIGGGISESAGVFEFSIPNVGATAVIEFISYESKRILLALPSSEKILDLGKLTLGTNAVAFQEIEIIGEKSMAQFALDKKVFNVGQDIASKGGTAQDVLDNVPSISVDVEGNVALRGNGNVRILIDGRPSGLVGISGTAGLRSIAANQIERIEVITNPSARYEAEGMSGIINIILKKDSRKGFNASFEAFGGVPQEYGAGANLNYRYGKFNFFSNMGARYRESPTTGVSYLRVFQGEDTFGRLTRRDGTRAGAARNIRAGMDVYLPNNQILTTSFGYNYGDNDNFTSIKYREFLFENTPADRQFFDTYNNFDLRTDTERETSPRQEASLEYRKTYDDPKKSLTAIVQYQKNSENEASDFEEGSYVDGLLVGNPLLQRSSNLEGENNFQTQVDYSQPIFDDGKLEFGARTSIRNIQNKYKVENLDEETWVPIPELTNDFNYDEAVHAAYGIIGNKLGKISFQGGIRYEYSIIETNLVNTPNGSNTQKYGSFFPSGHISYEMEGNNQVQLSYSRRIRRPSLWNLNPFFTFSDNRNFFAGNPNLLPEFTDAYELGHMKYFESGSLGSSLYYRRTTDAISRITTINPDGTTFTAPQNIAINENMGAEFVFNYGGIKGLKLDGELNLFYSVFDGPELPDALRTKAFVYTSRLSAKFTIYKGIDFQARINHRGPQNQPQGVRKAVTAIDLGFSKDIIKNTLSVSLNVRDLLNQRRRIFESFDENFFEEGNFQWQRNSAVMTVTYNINNKGQKQKKSGRDEFEGGGEM